MGATQYLALLRGINVGGGNIIRMADLKACFEASKLRHVATYIQSGNVLFESAETNQEKLAKKIETALSGGFSFYKARIVLRTHAELAEIVREAPRGFGHEPKKYRYDVIYLKEPMTASKAINSVTAKSGVDQVTAGTGVLYFSRLIAKAGQSHLARIVSQPVYQHMTIRNWNTTSKLLELLDARTSERRD